MTSHERNMLYCMATEVIAPCRCRANAWNSGDTVCSDFSEHYYRCAACLTRAIFLAQGSANVFIVGEQGGSAAFPYEEYVNRAIRPRWAVEFEALGLAREKISVESLHAVNAELGLPVGTRGDSVPGDLYLKWISKLDELHSKDEWRIPAGFEDSPLPPQMPARMLAYVKFSGGWRRISPAETAGISIPTHPSRARHDKAYLELFDFVRNALEVKFVPAELPNQYWNDPYKSTLAPWYSFFIGPVEFTVGPRKNVIHLSVKSPLPLYTKSIVSLHERDDKPTFECDANNKNILIHAWDHEKLKEYMLALGRAALVLGPMRSRHSEEHAFVVTGAVNWPTHLYDDGQGGMVVLAVVDGSSEPVRSGNPWARAELIEPNCYGIAEKRLEPVLACVPLGTSDGCWWRGNPEKEKHSDHDPYCPWECTLEELTSEGRQIVRMLQEMYGRPVRLVTHIDT